jgi:hypothetical protein
MEVLGKGARLVGETDVATVVYVADDIRVILEDGGGVHLVAAVDDVASCGFSAAAGCRWSRQTLPRGSCWNGLAFGGPGYQVAFQREDLAFVRVSGIAVPPVFGVQVLQELKPVGRCVWRSNVMPRSGCASL